MVKGLIKYSCTPMDMAVRRVRRVFFCRNNDAACVRMDLCNPPEGGQPIHFRHVDIQKDNIRVMLLRQLDSLNAIRGNGNHFHIVYCSQHQAGVAAGLLNVIGDEDPQFVFWGLRRFAALCIPSL